MLDLDSDTMSLAFQRKYNELKLKSYDIAIRISDLESGLGYHEPVIIKLKNLFSKLQSAINFAVYYYKAQMVKETKVHLDYSFKLLDYIYKILEKVEIPKKVVELEVNPEKKKFKIKLGLRQLLFFVVIAILYSLAMYWLFIR